MLDLDLLQPRQYVESHLVAGSLPLAAHLERGIRIAFFGDHDVHRAGQDIGDQRVAVRHETNDDAVERGAPEVVAIETAELHVRAALPLLQLERSQSHEVVEEVRAPPHGLLVLEVGVGQKVHGQCAERVTVVGADVDL